MLKSDNFYIQALKLLHNSTEFLPYVIYVAPPLPDDYKVMMENGRGSDTIELAVKCSLYKNNGWSN